MNHSRYPLLMFDAPVNAALNMSSDDAVIEWLLASDPAIRWQVMRDLLHEPKATYSKERQRIETEGWGAHLRSLQDPDGQWAGGGFAPADITAKEWKEVGQPWTATYSVLQQLREFGLDPSSDWAQRTVDLVGRNSRWDEGGQPFWEGETEECINGQTVANGSYFGVDMSKLVERLLGERMEDGGWNCERANGSVRSSFATTINVLEGLLELEKAGRGTPGSVAARKSGEEYLLKRQLFRRLSAGEPADEEFLRFLHPNRWRYDVLRALDYFRAVGEHTGEKPDARLKEAVEHVRSKRLQDGKWMLDWDLPGRTWFKVNDGQGKPSQWVTLRAMRCLKWWDENAEA